MRKLLTLLLLLLMTLTSSAMAAGEIGVSLGG